MTARSRWTASAARPARPPAASTRRAPRHRPLQRSPDRRGSGVAGPQSGYMVSKTLRATRRHHAAAEDGRRPGSGRLHELPRAAQPQGDQFMLWVNNDKPGTTVDGTSVSGQRAVPELPQEVSRERAEEPPPGRQLTRRPGWRCRDGTPIRAARRSTPGQANRSDRISRECQLSHVNASRHSHPPRVRWLPVLAVCTMTLLSAGCASNKKAAGGGSREGRLLAALPGRAAAPVPHLLLRRAPTSQPAKSKLDELIYGKETQQVLPLNKPYGVEMCNGKIYVCDLRNGSVTMLDLEGHRVLVAGQDAGGQPSRPRPTSPSPPTG